ncbi:glycoside hydrolase family 5 protein [Asaccharospora irregularis]|uniref:cellulase n=1 Tax=Asaccharospora irregularis DSM 2635 TaxID=1121321 RepID=A0A1M5RTG7_9FIRM|nr:glycoside hydrolase family 5 protein [Asaccharospora irregularis]SHH29490.1 Cellulase (glycosyl hydrolase family 5) [Asaccharospora irregularis DSM 2635]
MFNKKTNKSRFNVIILITLLVSLFLNIFLLQRSNYSESNVNKNALEENGHLSVKKTNLINENGDIVRLKGMSSHGLMWYPEYINTRSLDTLSEYGANAIRLAMYTDQNKGYIYNKKESMKNLLQGIENVLGADMYAIVDWHTLKDNNPNTYIEEAKEFFDEISTRYKDEPGVIYEIFNEPSGDTSWSDIKEYANIIIPIIRKNSPDAIILVGTPNHCVDIKSAINDPLEYENIMYTYHLYTGTSDGGYKYLLNDALKNDLAVFISEWGLSPEKGSGEIDFKKGREFIDFLDQNNISWINWSLSNKDEPYSFIRYDIDKLSKWNDDELTPVGKFIKDAFSN